MADFFRIQPTKLYETLSESCPILCAVKSATVANNQSIITGVTGQRIRIMGWIATGAGISTYTFKSGNGGSAIMNTIFAPNGATAGENGFFPITHSGYCETASGVGLYVDVTGFATNITVFYILYTP